MEVLKAVNKDIVVLGRLFDKYGNVKDWWSLGSKLDFEKRAECLVNQYNNYQVFGENVS